VVVSRKNSYNNALGYIAHRASYWNNVFSTQISLELLYDQAYAYLQKRIHWMRYRHFRSQGLPIGSGITEAACKIVFTQRLKCSGMLWTQAGGQVIVDLRVVWLSGVWSEVHQRYLASKPMPDTQADMVTGTQHEQQAA